MSVDYHYIPTNPSDQTEQFFRKNMGQDYDVLKLTTNEQGIVDYFAVNPKDKNKIINLEWGYEYSLMDDGRYGHAVISGEKDNQMELDVMEDIAISLEWEEDEMWS